MFFFSYNNQKSLKQRLGTVVNKTPIRLNGRIKILGVQGQPRVFNNQRFRKINNNNNRNQAFVINRVNANSGFKKKCNLFIHY